MISNDLERLLPNKWALKGKRISLYKLISTSTSEEDRKSPGQIRNEDLQCLGSYLKPSTCKSTRLALLCKKKTCSVLFQSPMKRLKEGSKSSHLVHKCLPLVVSGPSDCNIPENKV